MEELYYWVGYVVTSCIIGWIVTYILLKTLHYLREAYLRFRVSSCYIFNINKEKVSSQKLRDIYAAGECDDNPIVYKYVVLYRKRNIMNAVKL